METINPPKEEPDNKPPILKLDIQTVFCDCGVSLYQFVGIDPFYNLVLKCTVCGRIKIYDFSFKQGNNKQRMPPGIG